MREKGYVDELSGFAMPIRELSAFSAPGQRSIAIVMKVFLDGSGKSRHLEYRYLTLAALFASDSVWAGFELRWSKILDIYGVPYSHMKELLRGDGPFFLWKDEKKIAFVKALLTCLSEEERGTFIGCSLTVDLDDYRSFTGPNIKPVGAVCVDACMTYAFNHPDFRNGRAEAIFDRNEEFIHWMERIWSANKRNASSWASYLSTVAPADMNDIRPLQAADLVAWAANRHYNSEAQDFWKYIHSMCFFTMPHYHRLYRREELLTHPSFFTFKMKLDRPKNASNVR